MAYVGHCESTAPMRQIRAMPLAVRTVSSGTDGVTGPDPGRSGVHWSYQWVSVAKSEAACGGPSAQWFRLEAGRSVDALLAGH